MLGANIFYLYTRIGLLIPTHVYTPQPTIIDVVNYPWVKFPTLIQEHHNDSLMLLYVNMLRAAHDGTSSAIHRYIAAKLQIKIERTKKKGEKLKSCSLMISQILQIVLNILKSATIIQYTIKGRFMSR